MVYTHDETGIAVRVADIIIVSTSAG